ncbi:MAG: glycosyltransferase [Cellvibrio sp.]|uniref:glycosyltransferase family 2 protein n=1 Tax=Cellvibrio sp. TaxID=1965322 RepID=UPI00271B48B5|nr:glycosyltransferase [Cellvibrio sp.]
MATPWLSVLIPVYNVKDYLDDCFQSVISQCDANVEIIALDDQSTDDSFEYLQALAAKTSHSIKILQHTHNRGLSAARNSLVAAATGEYVWFLDSDDALVDGAIDQLRDIVNRHSPDLVMCDYQIWRPGVTVNSHRHKKESHITTFGGYTNCLLQDPEALFKGLYKKGKLHTWSKVSKRSLWLQGLQFPEGKYFEDMVTTPRLALDVRTYYYCPQVWVRYRQREGSILASFSARKVDDMMSGVDGVWALWSKKLPEIKMSTRYFFVRFCVKNYISAIKESRRISESMTLDKAVYRSRLYHNIGMGRKGLAKYYLLNGDFFRLLKALKVLQ